MEVVGSNPSNSCLDDGAVDGRRSSLAICPPVFTCTSDAVELEGGVICTMHCLVSEDSSLVRISFRRGF